MPKFITNSISTKTKFPTLSEIVKAAQTKQNMQKTASAEVVEKVASVEAPEAEVKEARGNASNFGDKKAPPFGKKDKKDEKKPCPCPKEASVKVAEKDEEGKDSGQPKAEGELVNDPHKDPKLKGNKAAAKDSGKDEAESSGQLDVEPLHQKGESTGEKPGDLDTQKDKKEKSATSSAWVKVANLTAKQKEFVRKTWRMYWPESFIDALLANK